MRPELKAFADGLLDIVKVYVGKVEQALGGRLDEAERAVATLKAIDVAAAARAAAETAVAALPKPENGKDADPAEVARMVGEAVAALPGAKDGSSVTVEDVAPIIAEQIEAAVKAIPAPAAGKDADPQAIDAAVRAAMEAIPSPKDGTSVTVEDLAPLVSDQVAKAVAALPAPKDGENIPVEQVQSMVDAAVAKAIAAVRFPKDGDPGRDAAHIEILPAIDAEKAYPRGTYAKHAGGLWRSYETTTDMKGWECIVDGLQEIEITFHGDPRKGHIALVKSSGDREEVPFTIPAMIYRGVFREGDDYAKGDTVTWGGSLWHCNAPTKDKPLDGSKSWQLAAKRGRDGKDGIDRTEKTAPVKLGT